MKNLKKIISVTAAAAMVMSTVAPVSVFADDATFKIGGIGPVTGAAAIYGQAVKNATELAINEVNEDGGINGYQVEFKFEDDENDAEKTLNAYNALKDWGMNVLVGTVTSTPCVAVANETAADNMFQLTPSGSATECVANPNVFRVCFSDPNQGTAAAQYIGEHKLATKVAIIYDSSDVYSSGITQNFTAEAANQGIEIVSSEAFTADNNKDFSVQLQKAKDGGAELVFLPIYYTEASLILAQADSMGFETKFFGCDGMDGILGVENFDTSLAEGVMLLTPFSATSEDEKSQAFVKAYEDANKDEVPNQFAADAYDAVYAVKLALEKAGVNDASMSASDICDKVKVAMTEITLDGVTGSTTWTADGEPTKIDFSKHFVVAKVLPVTNHLTNILLRRIKHSGDKCLILVWHIAVNDTSLAYSMQPMKLVILDKKYERYQLLEKVE